ncbi:MAG TPA: hypothetical protein VKZ41_04560 [Gemmatimonadales bacterium]|nr:hypothetical protein [Gemmatimonadales bacterium]
MKLATRMAAVAALLVFAACGGGQPDTAPRPGGSGAAGASSSRSAVDTFLSTIKAGDLQALALIWGTAEGPARDAGFGREELEQRELIMVWCMNHDAATVHGELPHGERGRAYRVDLTRGQRTRTTTMYTVPGPGGRWYVENVDLDPALRDFCRER